VASCDAASLHKGEERVARGQRGSLRHLQRPGRSRRQEVRRATRALSWRDGAPVCETAGEAESVQWRDINAHLQKGYALARKTERGALPAEFWRDVRAQSIKANGVENDHPVSRVQFYLTYLKQGEQPTKNAIDGLEWALQLAV
jgi:hypothetical protein